MSAFGVCPECRREPEVDILRNIRSHHFICCDPCRVYWHVGSNLLSGWTHETEETWEHNARVLDTFRPVEPLHPDTISVKDQAFLLDLGVLWL